MISALDSKYPPFFLDLKIENLKYDQTTGHSSLQGSAKTISGR
jgi:hypothetical protein